MKTASALLLLPLILAGCGDFPRPFAGNPGAQARRLSAPPPARLAVPAPSAALLTAQDAAALAKDLTVALVGLEVPAFATVPGPGDWQLRATATLAGGRVIPHFTVLDAAGKSRGDIDGAPVPGAAWAAGAPGTLQATAAQAAPRVVALLRSVDAAIKQSDPNSLYNRPASVFVAPVVGAPGDGNIALHRLIRAKLPDTGDVLAQNAAAADFVVRCTVRVTDLPSGEQQVEIHWHVLAANGHEAGDVAQGHDIPKGALSHYWGDVAEAITAEAAGGIHDVITNFTGRRAVKG